ncbi:MAG: peptide-methionine (S)-S-oxide reductase, partial [Candidatus Acidiferrales bacterium]
MRAGLLAAVGFASAVLVVLYVVHAAPREPVPAAKIDAPLAATAGGKETAVFAGGCFWGTQAVFERVKGVVATAAGYAGGSADTATY